MTNTCCKSMTLEVVLDQTTTKSMLPQAQILRLRAIFSIMVISMNWKISMGISKLLRISWSSKHRFSLGFSYHQTSTFSSRSLTIRITTTSNHQR